MSAAAFALQHTDIVSGSVFLIAVVSRNGARRFSGVSLRHNLEGG